ncbi:MAG: heparan-alpha-glucosaminide N-acetyltransferase domain-containing protein [Bacteroidota bacterium]
MKEITATSDRVYNGKTRVDSIDILRGLVMIIMALDHTRDYFHIHAWTQDPLNLATTTPALFLTRWITHFCAPIFTFLAGTSVWFQAKNKSKKELSSFLIKRGLWLVVVEIVVFNFAFSFDPSYTIIALQTIWSIGVSMIILGLLIWLPFKAVLAIGLLIVLGHNSLDFYEASNKGGFSLLYSIIHRPGFFPLNKEHSLFVLYPVLPWLGIMILGYCFGRLFTAYQGAERRKILSLLGIGLTLFFILLRAINIYGDPKPWSQQNSVLYTLFSFIDTQKYPPSLLYAAMTIGPGMIFLSLIEKTKNVITDIIVVYGRVPFLYYVLHFFLIHVLCMIFFLMRGHKFSEGIYEGPNMFPYFIIPKEGYSLGVVYLIWIGVIIVLYPVCKWFSEYKKTHRKWWLSYL